MQSLELHFEHNGYSFFAYVKVQKYPAEYENQPAEFGVYILEVKFEERPDEWTFVNPRGLPTDLEETIQDLAMADFQKLEW